MKVTQKNYIILSVVVAIVTFAYVGLLTLFGFINDWSWLKILLFFLLTFVLAVTPLAFFMRLWDNLQAARDKAYMDMKAKHAKGSTDFQ